jgi:hypothetical protein
MKTVKSAADLKKLALQQGAVLSMGGRKFNADGMKVKPVAAKPPAPKPVEPKPEPVAPPPAPAAPQTISIDMQPLAQEMAVSNSRMEMLMQRVVEVASARPERTAYRATVIRDDEGRIKHIDLTPKE